MSFDNELNQTNLAKSYIEPLLAGDRVACRNLIEQTLEIGVSAEEMLSKLIWPAMEYIQTLYKQDQISITSLNLATRLNRSLADVIGNKLERSAAKDRKVLIFCGNAEPEELGGQMIADFFEADGWNVRFAGGGVPDDEVLGLIGQERPNLVVHFATLASGVPAVRKLIDYLREVNSCPNMQIMCAGGIYNRADGLAEEIGADLYAPDAIAAVAIANQCPQRRASVEQQTVGRTRRIRKAEIRRAVRKGPGESFSTDAEAA